VHHIATVYKTSAYTIPIRSKRTWKVSTLIRRQTNHAYTYTHTISYIIHYMPVNNCIWYITNIIHYTANIYLWHRRLHECICIIPTAYYIILYYIIRKPSRIYLPGNHKRRVGRWVMYVLYYIITLWYIFDATLWYGCFVRQRAKLI